MTVAQASALMPPPASTGHDPAAPARDMGTPSDVVAFKRMQRV